MAHLSKWWFVTGVREEIAVPISEGGCQHQMVYYTLRGVLGSKETPEYMNPIAIAQHSLGHIRYFINENAKS